MSRPISAFDLKCDECGQDENQLCVIDNELQRRPHAVRYAAAHMLNLEMRQAAARVAFELATEQGPTNDYRD
jgi:hypothetical protein